ncbi:MAG TPA: HK97 family phage prohead protease, partial [Planctomycetaceae bacterium]|nr:HK97 family phage prohead protease [Planctomycetaceae bacterium]
MLRTISGYVIEWQFAYPEGPFCDWNKVGVNRFTYLAGSFDASIASGRDVPLTMDMDGVTVFARTGDGTLRITSDDVGLLVEADLLDTELNRVLVRRIDNKKVKGWSHRSFHTPLGCRVRQVDRVKLTEIHDAELREVTIVIRKVPRQLVRATPIFLSGGPKKWGRQ